jgi:chromosome segregation ATPase
MSEIKGMREVLALRTRRGTTETGRRGQLTAQMSRLDHQRTLLERQLAVWTGKMETTRQRLAALDGQIDEVELELRDLAERARRRREPTPRRAAPAGAPALQPADQPAPAPRSEMPFEY